MDDKEEQERDVGFVPVQTVIDQYRNSAAGYAATINASSYTTQVQYQQLLLNESLAVADDELFPPDSAKTEKAPRCQINQCMNEGAYHKVVLFDVLVHVSGNEAVATIPISILMCAEHVAILVKRNTDAED